MNYLRLLAFLITIFLPFQIFALDIEVEKDLQNDLLRSEALLNSAEAKIKDSQSPDAEIKALISGLENIKAAHLLLQERFNERQEKVKALGSKAAIRQIQMESAYSRAIEEYIQLIESYRNSTIGERQLIEQLKNLFDKILFKKKRPILGSLPYKNINYPSQEPDVSGAMVPAYKGGDMAVTQNDLMNTRLAPRSEEIVSLAQDLGWNPVSIYEYVKNNIDTEWYWGCMKGAEETLRQGSGNDCDQATLLTALLRASGFPARYVQGVIELDADSMKKLTGIDKFEYIAEYLQKAGVPYRVLIRGGGIGAFEIEHIWVESEIPYSNYRGAVIDEQGKTWLGLDTSIKVVGYEYSNAEDIPDSISLSELRDEYLNNNHAETPIEYVRAFLDSELAADYPGVTYDDLLSTRSLVPEVLNIIPASMQFEEKAITGEYTDIPDELIHKVRFTVVDANDMEILNNKLGTYLLSNRRITISYEPETVEDQEIINSYGGLDNTPSYLVRLRPVLLVNGERIAVAEEGLPMGADFKLAIELISSNGTEKIESTHITGNLSVIGISAQKAVSGQLSAISEEDNAETLLFKEAMRYMDRWNQAEDELSSLLHMSIVRPVPTIAVVGGVMDVTYLLDTPHGLELKGVYVDASLRSASPVQSSAFGVQSERLQTFMQLSALQGSVLEHRVFEDDLGVGSISTAKLLQVAAGNTGAGTDILTIDSTNIDSVLSALSYDDYIKDDIINAVNQGLVITVPETEITFEDWTGLGYIKENPATGEAGYMLSGMIAGGMSAWGMGRWPETYAEILLHPFSETPNQDPASASFIEKITATDFQIDEVGSVLGSPLQVRVVDPAGKPVKDALVSFRVKAGGGALIADAGAEVESLSVETNYSGIAEVKFKLGTKTSDNPTFMKLNPGDENYTQLGENIVEASLAFTGTKTLTPFTVFGKPGNPHKIIKAFGEGAMALVNSPAGSLRAMVVDQWADGEYPGNPISNVDLIFTASGKESMNQAVTLPLDARGVEFYINEECGNSYPLYGECATEETKTLKTAYFGALVNTILGNTVNTKYTVTVSSPGIAGEEFTLYSDGYRDEGDYLPTGLYIRYLDIVDDNGQPVNAAKVGTELNAPLTAELFMLYDEYQMEGPYACVKNGTPTDCWRINASGIVNVSPVTDGAVTYTPVEGDGEIISVENQGNGKYNAGFMAGSTAGVNNIEAEGEADVTVPEVFYDYTANKALTEDYEASTLPQRTVSLKSGQEVLFTQDTQEPVLTGSQKALYTIYVLDPLIYPSPSAVLIDNVDVSGYGYSLNDLHVTYTINPAQYSATAAYVDLIEDNIIINRIPSETSGYGFATYAEGYQFNPDKNYEVQVALNPGSANEVLSDKVPLVLLGLADLGNQVMVERVYQLSQFDGGSGPDYTDSYQTFAFDTLKPSTVSVKIMDASMSERGTVVAETSLAAGSYNVVVDYETIFNAGFSPNLSPEYYLLLLIEPDDGSDSREVTYPGRMSERSSGKMLGQTMVHDVLIQDGSLNLSRQDFALKGRGPQLAFSRSYNNQSSARGHRPLGEGWSHSLDLKLWPLSSAESGSGSIPDWVNNLKGQFYTDDQAPSGPSTWTLVSVNGTTFRNENGTWYAEKARHGTLEQSGSTYTYTSKDGTSYTYDYPVNHTPSPVQTIEDRNGNVMTFNYDSINRLETVADSVGRQLTFEYSYPTGLTGIYGSRLTKVTGPDGLELFFAYNDRGYLAGTTRSNRVETYAYSQEAGIAGDVYNLTRVTDSNGHSYTYEYYGPNEIDSYMATFIKVLKSQDVIKSVQYPDGNPAQFQYDVQPENKRIVTDLRGNDTTYTLNFYGNPTRMEEPEGKVTLMTWSIDEAKPDNVMTSKTDGRNNTTYYEYDGKGNINLETDSYSNTITTVWNQQFSLPESRTDRNNITQSWQYDANGNLLKHINGDSNETNYTYYPTGERQTLTDPLTYVINYAYDQWGNPDTITGPEGSITDFDHDIRGRRIAVTDPNGNKTEYAYDELDYPNQIIHPAITAYSLPTGSTNVQDFDYDAEGNLVKETNRLGLTMNYTYTARDQVETITRNIGGTKTFIYDENGNLFSETDWKGVETSHTYDGLNRRDSTTNRPGDTMYMAYDLADNLIEVTDYEGSITTYAYDKLNRLTDTWQPALEGETAGNIHNTYYNEADPKTNLKTVTDQEGNTTTYEYNGRYLHTKQINALLYEYIWDYDDNGNLTKETDEEINSIDYEYDKQNRLAVIVQTGNIRTKYQYDLNGNQTHVIDARNKDTEIQYDEWNRPYKVIDPANYSTITKYNGEGDEVKVTDGNGNPRTWKRDLRGLVLTAVDAEGKPTDYTYDLNGNVESITDARDMVSSITYDAEDHELTVTEASGTDDARTKEVLSRDKMGNPLQVKDYNGNITATGYNALYLPKRVCDPAPFNAQCRETTYYKTGKVKTGKNRRGYTTSYEYDALNREIRVTDARSRIIETTYDKVGNVKTVKDKRGIITENFYDNLYRLIHTERAGLRLVTNEYDDVGNITAVIDANNNRTEHTYNNRNLPDITTHPDTTTESRTYDGMGNLLTHTNEESKVTTYIYDKENRQTSVEFAGELTQKVYDENGNLIEVIKPEGNSWTMDYDLLNRLITVIDDPGGLNLATTYEYDANGNMTHQFDAGGNDVEFTYDNLNRKTQHIQHKASGNLVTQFTLYDAEGNLKTMIDPMGRTFTYDYDELDRQTDANYPDVASPFNKITNIHTEYDANNNVTSITETKTAPDSSTVTDTTVNNYDNFDRLDDSTQRGMTIDYGYDDNGNRTLVSTPAGTTTYTFDSRNRLKTAVVDGLITTYVYYSDGKKNTVTYPNGTYVKYTYHASNRIDTVANKLTFDGSVFSSYIYTYDKNGNRKTQVELQEGVTETTTYNYDRIDRMTDFTVDDGVNTTVNEYTFEGYNRKTETVTGNGTLVKDRTYNYDETDWLISIADSIQQSAISYSYDNNGSTILKSDSLLPDEDTTFVYDSRNQLVETKRGPPGSEVVLGQYDYNSSGLRVRHRLSERGDVDYYYDDNAVIEEHNASDDSLLAHYRYGDRLLTLNSELGTQYYHHDALGSTVNLTTETASVQVSYKLDPWGHIRSQTGTSVNRQIFTGQEHDENTGLIYFGARYYDPDTARFITQDSYLGEQNTPPSLHRYLYAYSNPTVYWDKNGESATAVGAVTGFMWGFGQMIGGMVSDVINDNYRSTKEYLGVWGQNIYAGAMIGASIDVGFMSGGMALPAAGALGGMGFESMTLQGKGAGNWEEFGKGQLRGGAIGAVAGPVLGKAASAGGKALGWAASKSPIAKGIIEGTKKIGQKFGQKIAEKASALDDAVMSEFSKESISKTGQRVQGLINRAVSKVKPRVTAENVAGDEAITVARLSKGQNPVSGPVKPKVGLNTTDKLNPWNKFPKATKGQFENRREAAKAYKHFQNNRNADFYVTPTGQVIPGKRLVIGRGNDLKQLRSGEYKLEWPPTSNEKGFSRSEWKVNKGLLRTEMSMRRPIRDASPYDKEGWYTNLERQLLRSRGWKQSKVGDDVFWYPPNH